MWLFHYEDVAHIHAIHWRQKTGISMKFRDTPINIIYWYMKKGYFQYLHFYKRNV
jgi:hypothetical protein